MELGESSWKGNNFIGHLALAIRLSDRPTSFLWIELLNWACIMAKWGLCRFFDWETNNPHRFAHVCVLIFEDTCQVGCWFSGLGYKHLYSRFQVSKVTDITQNLLSTTPYLFVWFTQGSTGSRYVTSCLCIKLERFDDNIPIVSVISHGLILLLIHEVCFTSFLDQACILLTKEIVLTK